MIPRSPVVTILGHVDHGKTTLLDFIRKTKVASKEHGGITQKIGAYEVVTGIKGYPTDKITFIDTPGHEAFSLLRARGAQVADIAILVVDAKDSLMPQTIESISHIKNAKIPFIVAINKIDLPDVNPDKIKNDLLQYEVLVEEKGGKIPAMLISAKTGKGVPELLEMILLIAADSHFTYNPKSDPKAYVIETKKDKRGAVATIILKDGVLHIADTVYAYEQSAKIRSLINDTGKQVSEVVPSKPVELLGFDQIPPVGALVTNKPLSNTTQPVEEHSTEPEPLLTLETLIDIKPKEKKLSLVIKADSQGSLEAIHQALVKNPKVNIVLEAVGEIHKSDIFLAKTSGSIVIGFSTKVDQDTQNIAKQEKIIIKTYNIIYELLDELNEVADLLKEKEEQAKHLKGEGIIQATFTIEGEKIYGIKVTKGKFNLGEELQLFRSNNQFGKTKLVSLQIRAKKQEEVKKDQEAGIIISPPLDIRVGDVIKCIL